MNKKNRKGFTIVELVIVIAVIGILATVLVPTFGTVISDAKNASNLQGAKNVYTNYVSKHADAEGVDISNCYVTYNSVTFQVTGGQINKTPVSGNLDASLANITDASGKCSANCAH